MSGLEPEQAGSDQQGEQLGEAVGEDDVQVPPGVLVFRESYPSAAWLVEGLEHRPVEERLDALVTNFLLSEFQWTGQPTTPEAFLAAGATGIGDCGTIAGAFVLAAQALGFEAEKVDYDGPMYVANGGPVTGGGLTGNIDGGPDWYFDDHHTVKAGGRELDLLFLGKEGAPSYVEGTSDRVNASGNSIYRWVFGDVTVYEGKADDPANRYTKSWELANEYAGSSKEWAAQLAASAKPTKVARWDAIDSADPEIRRDGVQQYVATIDDIPADVAAWLVSHIIATAKLPTDDDSEIVDILGKVSTPMGVYVEQKYLEWSAQFR